MKIFTNLFLAVQHLFLGSWQEAFSYFFLELGCFGAIILFAVFILILKLLGV